MFRSFKNSLVSLTLLTTALGLSVGFFRTQLPSLWVHRSVDDRTPTLIHRIRALSRMETVAYTEQKLLEGRKEWAHLPDWLLKDRLLFLAQGDVVAGVDLSHFGPDRLIFNEGRAVVRLPRAEVFHVRLDNTSSTVCSRSTGWLNRPDPQLETQVRQGAERSLLESALKDGILDRARRNAESEIRRLATLLGAKEVIFI